MWVLPGRFFSAQRIFYSNRWIFVKSFIFFLFRFIVIVMIWSMTGRWHIRGKLINNHKAKLCFKSISLNFWMNHTKIERHNSIVDSLKTNHLFVNEAECIRHRCFSAGYKWEMTKRKHLFDVVRFLWICENFFYVHSNEAHNSILNVNQRFKIFLLLKIREYHK